MNDQQIAAREACDAVDAIFTALENWQKRALAEQIHGLVQYLKSQMRNEYQEADPQTVRSHRLTFSGYRVCCPVCRHEWVVGQFDR